MSLRIGCLVWMLCVLCSPGILFGQPIASVTGTHIVLAWDASPTPDVFYRICFGNGVTLTDGSIDRSYGCHDVTTLTTDTTEHAPPLPVEVPIHARAYAVTKTGIESGPSNGVEFTLEYPAPEAPTNLRTRVIISTTTTTSVIAP
jgi:hypothetical protein